MRCPKKFSGITLIELTVIISIMLLISVLIYQRSGIGDSAHRVRLHGLVAHINIMRNYINLQINELGCAPLKINAMLDFNSYRQRANNSCNSTIFKNSWNGPYLPIKKLKTAPDSTLGGKVLLAELMKNTHGIIRKHPQHKYIYVIQGINNKKILEDLAAAYNKDCAPPTTAADTPTCSNQCSINEQDLECTI